MIRSRGMRFGGYVARMAEISCALQYTSWSGCLKLTDRLEGLDLRVRIILEVIMKRQAGSVCGPVSFGSG
jgi:hypothetical protein